MKKFAAILCLCFLSGCYNRNEAIMESGRPVELHLQGMDHKVNVAIPEIDGSEYAYLFSDGNGQYTEMFHWPLCRNCEKRTWPDGVEPVKEVKIRDGTTLYIRPFRIGDCDYFTVHTWGGGQPSAVVHRGHCKACSKRQQF